MMNEVEFIHFGIGMFSVLLGFVGGMIILGILHDYCEWFK